MILSILQAHFKRIMWIVLIFIDIISYLGIYVLRTYIPKYRCEMKATAAITREIGELKSPLVTSYQLGKIIFEIYKTRRYRGEKIQNLRKETPQRTDYTRYVRELETLGVLQNQADALHREIFAVMGQEQPSAMEAICQANPFCYISHMSAMSHHGLTDRLPKIIFLSTPTPRVWAQMARNKMQKDIGDFFAEYQESGFPTLMRLQLPKIFGQTISSYTSEHYDAGAYVSIQGKSLRVASIGRTFLDMLREPELCGSIHHVLNVYKQYAERYLRLILDEVERHGSKIDKVRAGFILGEYLKLSSPIIESWHQYAQRGGSRKLVASAEYSPHFSEKWCLSINVDMPE